ncbi:MAG: HAMP domain-containing protein [Zoogloea sp.]|nr:HAMP domain-containing protein [Zoogloea sp.]
MKLAVPPRLSALGRLARLPRTLLWRIFLLVALLMLLSAITWSAIFTYFEMRPRAQQVAQMVASVVNLTRTALINAEPARRKELLLELAALEGIRVYPAEDSDVVRPLPDTPLMRAIAEEVRLQLGPQTRFASEWENLPGFWVSFRLDPDDPDEQDEFWTMLPPDRVNRPRAQEWLGWGGAVLFLALTGAYFIVSRVNLPLKSLARAARAVGRGETPPTLDERGPAEIATVAHAFNQMSRDLARLDADRALILAGISHDLRTPLARLRLGIEMSGASDEDVGGMVTDIEEMDRIIGQFLEFAREGAGEKLEEADLSVLAGELADAYTRRGVDLSRNLAPAGPVAMRPMAIRRAVSNLVDNALRYAPGPLEIETGMERQTAYVEVRDHGIGIPAEDVERMKRPFTRMEDARSNAKGSGLGLAIVDRIARGHGGELQLLEREGGGLRARILLPRAKALASG